MWIAQENIWFPESILLIRLEERWKGMKHLHKSWQDESNIKSFAHPKCLIIWNGTFVCNPRLVFILAGMQGFCIIYWSVQAAHRCSMCHPHQKWLWNSNSISNRLHSMKLEKKRVRNLKHYWKSREKINQMWNNNSKIGKKMSRGKISPLFLLFSNLIMHNSTNIC